MAGSSNFLQFNPSLNNSLSDTDYNSDLTRINGLNGGIARSDLHNKLFYQTTTMISALGKVFSDLGFIVSDSNVADLTTVLSNILTSVAIDGDTLTYSGGTLKANFNNIMPHGTIINGAWLTIPTGFLTCDGAAISRTAYANLFAAIGITFGSGDGSTTFNVPNLKDKFLLSKGTTYTTLGATGGEINHTLTTSEIPSHLHYNGVANDLVNPYVYGVTTTDMPGNATSCINEENTSRNYQGKTSTVGGGTPHNNMPPYIVITSCIKY